MTAIKKQSDGSIELTIDIPISSVKKTWDLVTDELAKQTTFPGFRKGKAPKNLVEQNLDKEKVREEVLKTLLPKAYVEAVKEHNLRPIINPKIHVNKLDDPESKEAKPWQFIAITCESPVIDLKDYKDAVKKITAKSKIIVPGKEPQTPSLDEVVNAVLSSVSITIPQVLLDGEVERLLAQMLDEIKRLGLTLDQYLQSTRRNIETLKAENTKKAENDIKLEFALQEIAKTEKISVEEKEIEEAIQKAKDEKERQSLQTNRYTLASILRQQKTLDFLKNL